MTKTLVVCGTMALCFSCFTALNISNTTEVKVILVELC